MGVLVQRVRDAPNPPPLSDRRRDFKPGRAIPQGRHARWRRTPRIRAHCCRQGSRHRSAPHTCSSSSAHFNDAHMFRAFQVALQRHMVPDSGPRHGGTEARRHAVEGNTGSQLTPARRAAIRNGSPSLPAHIIPNWACAQVLVVSRLHFVPSCLRASPRERAERCCSGSPPHESARPRECPLIRGPAAPCMSVVSAT